MKAYIYLVLIYLNCIFRYILKHLKKIILLSLFTSSILILAFPCRISILRLSTSFKDLGLSIAYAFINLFKIDSNLKASILNPIPNYGLSKPSVHIDSIKNSFSSYFTKFFDIKNYLSFNLSFVNILMIIFQSILFLLLVFMAYKLIKELFNKKIVVNPYLKSKAYTNFKLLEIKILLPTYTFLIDIKNTLLNNTILKTYFILWFLISFNLLTVIIEFFSYYIYLIVKLEISSSILIIINKLIFDIRVYFEKLPLIFHILISIYIFLKIRLSIGYTRLKINEARNKVTINNMPIISMFTGSMGTNKTTMISDIAMSKSEIFKNKALEFILDIKKRYPNFNFNLFDNLVINSIYDNKIYNIVSIDDNFDDLISNKDLNYKEYTFDNALVLSDIYKDLKEYIKLMLIYITSSNLIFSNYAIRTDNSINHLGNFPVYNTEYFKRDSYIKSNNDIFSHVLDFDLMRLNRRISNNNHNFDFGIFVITEIGKERGNQITQQGLKKDSDIVNQKNDNFNNFVKLIRHYSTICNYPFCFFLCDDQRSESINADLRELMYLYKISKNKRKKIMLPFYGFEKTISEILLEKYNYKMLDRIYRRSDTTLSYYLVNLLIHFIYKRYSFYTNTFTNIQVELLEEEGSHEGYKDIKKYNLSLKKIYSSRFSTDAYEEYFKYEKYLSKKGINDYPRYKDVKANRLELSGQHSFLINELENIKGDQIDENI